MAGCLPVERRGIPTVTHVPPVVVRAVVLANELGFEHLCLPEQGRLLRVLAAGRGWAAGSERPALAAVSGSVWW